MMHPEDRLDALLTALGRGERVQGNVTSDRAGAGAHPGQAAGRRPAVEDGDLAPLLDATRRLDSLRTALPDPRFAQALRARMLERAADLRREDLAPILPLRQEPGHPAAWAGALASFRSAIRPALIAAAVLLALGIGTLTVAMAAEPGSPLFGLHRLEQGVRANAMTDPSARAQVHLQYARQWLAALRDAAANHRGDPAYSSALQALRDDDAAAGSDIGQMSPGPDRASLDADLAALHADERTILRAVLPAIGWPDRIATTQALGTLGVPVPRVTEATLAHVDGNWRATLTGSGFQPGAVLLANGVPAGHIAFASAGAVVAELPVSAFPDPPHTLGVGNPDGTAAETGDVRVIGSPEDHSSATPEREGTATPAFGGEREGTGTATPGSGAQWGAGTPTPVPTSASHESGGSGTPTPTSAPNW
jgi:hypothetical protein